MRRSSLEPPGLTASVHGRAKGGGIDYIDDSEHQLVIGIGTAGYRIEIERLMARSPSAPIADIVGWDTEAPGSLIAIDKRQFAVHVRIDLLGCFPIFVRRFTDEIRLSDQVSELSSGSEDVNPAGVTEYLRFGFCVGNGTPFKNVRRIRPGEYARLLMEDGAEHFEDRSTLWANRDAIPATRALEAFCDGLKNATRLNEPARLMMSGGWDSRLLLAASLASGGDTKPALYFHGDTESREAGLVRRIQASESLEAQFVEIVPRMFDPDLLAQHFAHFESVSFPFWHAARESGTERVATVMAGIFGEVVGGHYGPPMAVSGRRKLTESLAWLIAPALAGRQAREADGLARACEIYRQRPYIAAWYMHRDAWHDLFSSVHLDVETRIHASLDRYRSRGVVPAHALIEAFITEHRGSQFIAAQLHSAARPGAFLAPFANRSLIEIAAAIPFQGKAFNRFSQAAVGRLWPPLLQFPLAATLSNANRPIFVLEASRALRKLYEAARRSSPMTRLHRSTSEPHLSWVNFSAVTKSGILHAAVDSLVLPYWDKPRLHDAVENVTADRAHPLTDMILKINTLDLLCTKSAAASVRASPHIVS